MKKENKMMKKSNGFTLVYDVNPKKFMDVIKNAKIDNKRFKISQFQKSIKDHNLTWCMLFDNNRNCVAAANVDQTNGPGGESTYISEIQVLISGNGYGKKMLQMICKKYKNAWLMADPSASSKLVSFYRDPSLDFNEFVLKAADSIYGVDTHFFMSKSSQLAERDWISFLSQNYGSENAKSTYNKSKN